MKVCITALLLSAALPAAAAPARKPAAKAPAKPAVRKPAPKAPAGPALPPLAKEAVKLTVEPGGIALDGPRSVQHLIITAHLKDGATLDVSEVAVVTLANPKLAKIEKGVVSPLADGETQLTAKLGSLTAAPVAVTVVNAKAPRTVEFVNDVMPVLAKAGCNSTACHGSPAGKGGLKLSLFGYEPELDYVAIAKDGEGKRVNLKAPEQSLFLQKATLAVPHAGGQRFKPNSREYYALLFWLKEGAPGIGEFEARVRSVEVLPAAPWLPTPTAKQRLAVTAHMTDGSTQDVTDKVLFSSNDDAIAAVDDAGEVEAKRSGETAVMVRYMGQVGVSRIAVLPTWKLPTQNTPKANYIDEAVQAKLQRLRVVPSDLCTDEEFIRRVSLDVRGIIPTPDEVRAFLADRSADKRAKLIDQYLESGEFVDLWTLKWNDTLRNNPRLARLGTQSYAKWIREQVAGNVPFDKFVRELLTAEGRNTEQKLDPNNLPRQLQNRPGVDRLVERLNRQEPNAAANYFVISRDPLDTTSATSQVFLGVRIECARCHNHPFEKWTQTDYYGLAAFFTGVTAQGNNQTPVVVSVNPRAPGPRHPRTNEVVEPKTLDNAEAKIDNGTDKREVLVNWMVSPQNPWFAKAMVNRIWGFYFGRGIVEPIDDIRVTNPASNPELWDALARDFTAKKFDVKHIHRTILNSRTYQSSSKANQWNKQDTTNFARYYPKRMMAEQLYDSISQATDVFLNTPAGFAGRGRPNRPVQIPGANRYGAGPTGDVARAMQLTTVVPGQGGGGGVRGGAGVIQFLNTFGKARREVVCECERTSDGNIGQALALLNGDEVNGKLAHPRGRLQELLRSGKPDLAVAEELYLAVLSRRPTSTELDDAATLVRSSKSKQEGFEDLMWGLLNSREFLFVH
jgi:hypothetical protein